MSTFEELNAATVAREAIEQNIPAAERELAAARAAHDEAWSRHGAEGTAESAQVFYAARDRLASAHAKLNAAQAAHAPAKQRELDAIIADVVAGYRR